MFSYDVMFADVIFFLQYLIYELRYRSLNLNKFVEQNLGTPLREITLNLSAFLLNCPHYLSCKKDIDRRKLTENKHFKKRNFQRRRIPENKFVTSENVT